MNHRSETMLHTHEATLQPDGRLQFTDAAVHQDRRPRHVLMTFADEITGEATDRSNAETPPVTATDWQGLVGVLADSPHWRDDPVAIQQGMRDEWH
jgi:hypothetical protein